MNHIEESLKRIKELAKKKTVDSFAKAKIQSVSLVKSKEIDLKKVKKVAEKEADVFLGDFYENIDASIKDIIAKNSKQHDSLKLNINPKNCKFITEDENGNGMIILEESPQMRTILGRNDGAKQNSYRIPLPYILFSIVYKKTKDNKYQIVQSSVCFMNSSLKTFEDEVFQPALPHCAANYLCMDQRKACSSVEELISYFVDNFWNTQFVYGVPGFVVGKNKSSKAIHNFDQWSKVALLDILSVKWQRYGKAQDLYDNLYRPYLINDGSVFSKSQLQLHTNMKQELLKSITQKQIVKLISSTIEKINHE